LDPKTCNGSPVIKGIRVCTVDVVIECEHLNHAPDDIITAHPYLKLEQIHDALSYYYENREQLDKKIKQDRKSIQQLANAVSTLCINKTHKQP
jgi:uncharacterized protein (DUF433 family)